MAKNKNRKKGTKVPPSKGNGTRQQTDYFNLNSLRETLESVTEETSSIASDTASRLSLDPRLMDSPSRIPVYKKNGVMPHHLPFHLREQPQPQPCEQHSGRLVPIPILRQHQQHYLQTHSRNGRFSAPSSPMPSACSTPSGFRRASFGQSTNSSGQSTIPSQRPTTSQSSGRLSCLEHNPHRCDSYVPLCELQRALKKGEVLEGILRINSKNWEDAYISAPVILGRGTGHLHPRRTPA